MLSTKLTKHTGHAQRRVHYPTVRQVHSDNWHDQVSVKLVHGQCAASYAVHAQEVANSFGARSYRIRVDRPRRIWLDLIHTDPRTDPVRVPALADPGTAVDLARVVIGRIETGRPWALRLLGRHILVAGVSDAGKSSVISQPCVRALRRHRAQQAADRVGTGDRWTDSGLVFTTRKGTPIEPRNINRTFDVLVTRAGVTHIRFHDLRHSCAYCSSPKASTYRRSGTCWDTAPSA